MASISVVGSWGGETNRLEIEQKRDTGTLIYEVPEKLVGVWPEMYYISQLCLSQCDEG